MVALKSFKFYCFVSFFPWLSGFPCISLRLSTAHANPRTRTDGAPGCGCGTHGECRI